MFFCNNVQVIECKRNDLIKIISGHANVYYSWSLKNSRTSVHLVLSSLTRIGILAAVAAR